MCRRNGWKCVGRGVGAGGGASRREPRGGVVPLQSPRPPCRRLLLIGFSTAGLRLLSPAGPSAGERTRELSGWFGPGRLPPHCPSPHPAPHRHPAPASVPDKGPQHQHGLLHRKLEGLGDGHSAWPGGRGTREAPGGRVRDGSGCRRPSSSKGAC